MTASRSRPRPSMAARDMKPHADRAARLLRSLANEQRLLLLCNLLDGPMSVGELNRSGVALSQSALSQHLAVLREAGVVTTERRAQSILYALPRGPVIDIIRVLKHEFCG